MISFLVLVGVFAAGALSMALVVVQKPLYSWVREYCSWRQKHFGVDLAPTARLRLAQKWAESHLVKNGNTVDDYVKFRPSFVTDWSIVEQAHRFPVKRK
jgi:hypothetical protein